MIAQHDGRTNQLDRAVCQALVRLDAIAVDMTSIKGDLVVIAKEQEEMRKDLSLLYDALNVLTEDVDALPKSPCTCRCCN